jgi:hypothetical protein
LSFTYQGEKPPFERSEAIPEIVKTYHTNEDCHDTRHDIQGMFIVAILVFAVLLISPLWGKER